MDRYVKAVTRELTALGRPHTVNTIFIGGGTPTLLPSELMVRLLVTTDDSILTVAMEAGFQSLSRFNEAFKEACGCSPRDYRKFHKSLELH